MNECTWGDRGAVMSRVRFVFIDKIGDLDIYIALGKPVKRGRKMKRKGSFYRDAVFHIKSMLAMVLKSAGALALDEEEDGMAPCGIRM